MNDVDMDEIRNFVDSCRGRRSRLTERVLINVGKLILLNCFMSFCIWRIGKSLWMNWWGDLGRIVRKFLRGCVRWGIVARRFDDF